MTYIVGISALGCSCIICDTRVTYGQSAHYGSNDALKSGKLFTGCIYGASGSVRQIKEFLSDVRASMPERDVPERFWRKFCEFVSAYNFSSDEAFQMILASRHSGKSRLYLIDSNARSITEADSLITIGSGKNLLDKDLQEIHSQHMPRLSDYLTQAGADPGCFPYLYCLWLMERAQGFEASRLNDAGVGGYFHFTGQKADFEARQAPALYVMSEAYPERREIRSWIYRMAFVDNAMVIDCPIQQSRSIIVDVSIWLGFKELSSEEQIQFFKRVVEKTEKDSFYFFCGFGFINPAYRRSLGVHFTTKHDYRVSRKGEIIDPAMKRLIELNFEEFGA